jgi:xanthine dehydrogenase accessory factor
MRPRRAADPFFDYASTVSSFASKPSPNEGENASFLPEAATAAKVLEVAAKKASEGKLGAMATVLARHGSAPSTPGQKLYVCEDGTSVGTVGGGAVEREVLAALGTYLVEAPPGHAVRELSLGAELGMCCGGRVEILFEPIAGLVPCLVVGGGHVATATAPLLAKLGFAVTVVDERDAWGEEGRIPGVRTLVGAFDELGDTLPSRGIFLVMTHDHQKDQRAIEWALGQRYAFVGGVGSRAKAVRTRQRLLHRGFSEAQADRVRMPVGIDIGARLPDEIAVSIAAELVRFRREK